MGGQADAVADRRGVDRSDSAGRVLEWGEATGKTDTAPPMALAGAAEAMQTVPA